MQNTPIFAQIMNNPVPFMKFLSAKLSQSGILDLCLIKIKSLNII